MVTAVVNGRLEVLRVHIEPALLETPDREMLQDLVVAAVNEALRAARAIDRRGDAEGDRRPAHPRAGLTAMAQTPSMSRLIEQLTQAARHRREDRRRGSRSTSCAASATTPRRSPRRCSR